MDDLPKSKDRIQKFKETRDSQNIYESEQNKACFSHDVANGDFEDSTRKIVCHKNIWYC